MYLNVENNYLRGQELVFVELLREDTFVHTSIKCSKLNYTRGELWNFIFFPEMPVKFKMLISFSRKIAEKERNINLI